MNSTMTRGVATRAFQASHSPSFRGTLPPWRSDLSSHGLRTLAAEQEGRWPHCDDSPTRPGVRRLWVRIPPSALDDL